MTAPMYSTTMSPYSPASRRFFYRRSQHRLKHGSKRKYYGNIVSRSPENVKEIAFGYGLVSIIGIKFFMELLAAFGAVNQNPPASV